MSWYPIVKDEELTNQIKLKIDLIDSCLDQALETSKLNTQGLMGGTIGICLFKHYKSLLDKRNCDESITKTLNIVFENSNKFYENNLSVGIAGLFYLLNHLDQNSEIEFDKEVLNFNPELLERKVHDAFDLDFLHGLTGIVVSLLESNDLSLYSKTINYWYNSLCQLSNHGKTIQNLFYPMKVSDNVEKNGISLGISHGVPSLICTLVLLYKKTKEEKYIELSEKFVNYLVTCKFEKNNEYYFPCAIIEDKKEAGKLAWCYGDLGCIIAIEKFASIKNDISLHQICKEILLFHASNTIRNFDYKVIDPDFCHGSIGIAHVFARYYNIYKINSLKQASEIWINETLSKGNLNNSSAGFTHFDGVLKTNAERFGLLEGICGIGLSLISSISNVEPKWDRVFLIS